MAADWDGIVQHDVVQVNARTLFWVGLVIGALLMSTVQVATGVIPCGRNCSCHEHGEGDSHDDFPTLGPQSLVNPG